MNTPQFRVELPAFQRPLENLVLAVRRGDLSLLEMPLGMIASQLLTLLQDAAAHEHLDIPLEWIDLAARLIRWKSLALLPAEESARTIAEAELRQAVESRFRQIGRNLEYLLSR